MSDDESRKIIAGVCPRDLDEYAAAAEALARAGATHMVISGLTEKSRHEIDDSTDPYLQWAIVNPTLFKFAPPEDLSGWIPAEYAAANMEQLRRRSEILARVGLRGVFMTVAPMYLPESVYEAHPAWRGPRVDQPRRSRHPRFAPCIDQPEVLALYREAARNVCAAAPVLDTFRLGTNDSGAGICWSDGLYPEANGPAACRERHYGRRVADWLAAFQLGAQDAGVEAEVFIVTHAMSEAQVASIAAVAPKGVGFLVRRGAETLATVPHQSLASVSVQAGDPVVGVPNPWGLAEAVASVRDATRAVVRFGSGMSFRGSPEDLMVKVYGRALAAPVDTTFGRVALLREIAAEEVGLDKADGLLEMWMDIGRGLENLNLLSFGGTFTQIAITAQRWLTRPLVPFPMELTPDEKDYYRPFLFQANSEEEASDMTNLQANKVVVGVAHARTIGRLMGAAAGPIGRAIQGAVALRDSAKDETARDAFELLSLRLRALASVIRTCTNVPMFQAYMDRRKAAIEREVASPTETPEWMPGEPERTWVMETFRDELDNVTELIGVLTAASGPVFRVASDKAREDTFTFGPDLVEQLDKKQRIMMDHWLDFDRLYARPNR